VEKTQMRSFERLQQIHHRLLESVSRSRGFNCGAMARDRVLPVLPEEFRFVEFGFESLQNTLKNIMSRFVRQARVGARGSIRIHTTMITHGKLLAQFRAGK
jgi:hypothetical protein